MSNATSKNISRLLPIAVTSILLSCGGNTADKKAAESLLEEASAKIERGDFQGALMLTDSIKNAYPAQIEARRNALHLASRATEGLTVRRLETADSLLAILSVECDSLSKLVKYVDNPIEGYYLAKISDPVKFIGSTGLQARVSPEGDFYLMSSLTGHPVKSTSIRVMTPTGGSAVTSSVGHDGERNDRSGGREVITFISAECDSVGHFISSNRDSSLTVTFIGEKEFSTPLAVTSAEEIAVMYDYATTVRKLKVASLEKERLSRALEIARSQAARTYVDEEAQN